MTGPLLDLASESVGGAVLAANDDFFAPKENLVRAAAPVWRDGEYNDRGKWMDGWETRRRREPGSDWAVVRLGLAGVAERVEIDTTFFTGNFPEAAEVWATGVGDDRDPEDLVSDDRLWEPLVPRSRLEGNHLNAFGSGNRHRLTHVKLVIHPDGGVARLRVLGRPVPGRKDLAGDVGLFSADDPQVDISALALGSGIVAASDEHFSDPRHLLLPTEPAGMHDGWETRRRRGPGNDWVIVKLGLAATPKEFEVDTRHFRGNAPGWVSVDGTVTDGEVPGNDASWVELVAKTPLAADTQNRLTAAVEAKVSHVRLNIHPDGGVARFRVLGRPDVQARTAARLDYLNALGQPAAESFFRTACGSRAWVNAMLAGLPYPRVGDVLAAAEGAFHGLGEVDWLEAFAAHPRIGGAWGGQTADGEGMSAAEQSAVGGAGEGVLARMAAANDEYETRFGFRYIVSAAGQSGAELLAVLEQRLGNDRPAELAEAAAQQRAITRLRLGWMLCVQDAVSG
jgi:allantoicase